MAKKQIKLTKLVAVLKQLGFQERRKGSHGIFFEPETGVIITLPMDRKEVPVVYLKAALKQIVHRGIIDEDNFWRLL
ncbi:MAG: type II toxin-antitoxin system HicA family toxin [Thermodesulfobacteriota bacterium]